MTCNDKDIKELIPLYLEDVLEQPDRERVEDHLGTCGDCRSEIALLRSLAQEPVPDPGAAFWSRMPSQVYRQVQEQEEHARHGRFGILQGLLMLRWAWASAAVLMIAATAWLLMRPLPEAPTVAVLTGPGALEEELLSDDTVDVASLGTDEAENVGSWADQEMQVLASEAGAVMKNGKDANIYEELAELDRASLERLSRMLDQLKKGGQV